MGEKGEFKEKMENSSNNSIQRLDSRSFGFFQNTLLSLCQGRAKKIKKKKKTKH
jgi:hypothetical protein